MFAFRPKGAEAEALRRRSNELLDPAEFQHGLPFKERDLTDEQMQKIILDIAGGMSVREAARENHVDLLTVMIQRIAHEEFGQAVNDAITIRNGLLEDKAFDLAYHGEETTIEKEHSTTTRTEYPSANLLQFLLKANFPEKYGVDRKEIRAGPLETPPEVVRNEGDRERLLSKVEHHRRARIAEAKKAVREAVVEETFEDLLG